MWETLSTFNIIEVIAVKYILLIAMYLSYTLPTLGINFSSKLSALSKI